MDVGVQVDDDLDWRGVAAAFLVRLEAMVCGLDTVRPGRALLEVMFRGGIQILEMAKRKY
jgi:hypothetical protein